jgi:hypothetical protein
MPNSRLNALDKEASVPYPVRRAIASTLSLVVVSTRRPGRAGSWPGAAPSGTGLNNASKIDTQGHTALVAVKAGQAHPVPVVISVGVAPSVSPQVTVAHAVHSSDPAPKAQRTHHASPDARSGWRRDDHRQAPAQLDAFHEWKWPVSPARESHPGHTAVTIT